MVYESDFSRRQFLNSCAESGLFYSSPDYKPQSYLSTLRAPTFTTPTSPLTNSRSERTARLLASLSTNTQPLPRFDPQPKSRQSFDPEHPYTSSEVNGIQTSGGESYGIGNFRTPASHGPPQRSCCACCHSCGGGAGGRGGSVGRFAPPESIYPFGGASNLSTQHGMESYIKSRRPNFEQDETFQMKPKSTYSIRNVPVRSLDELRETVAIRRNYIKERQKLLDESNGTLSIPFLERRENSMSPQPDGSIVTYPSEKSVIGEGKVMGSTSSGGGTYYEVQESGIPS